MMKNYVIIIALFFLLPQLLYCQETKKLKIVRTYKNAPLLTILEEFEKNYGCHFYYINEQLEGVNITATIDEETVGQAIKIIIGNTDLQYYVNSMGGYVIYQSSSQMKSESMEKFTLSGKVLDSKTKEPLPFATVFIRETGKGSISDDDGNYKITNISEGIYLVTCNYIGFIPLENKINLSSDQKLDFNLTENIFDLKEVEITPEIYKIHVSENSPRILSKKEILYSPNIMQDITRNLSALPGIANNDVSSRPRIRGGSANENAFILDHFEIIEPFHFEEFDGLYSIINTDYISSIKVFPGGFPARYPNKLSGIIDLKTSDYVNKNEINFSMDFVNMTALVKANLNKKTSVQISARKTYLGKLLLSNVSDDIKVEPVCYDVWTKVNHILSTKHQLSFNFLFASDLGKAVVRESSYNWINLDGKKYNYYSWINWKYKKNDKTDFLTTIGYQKLSKRSDFTFHNSISSNNPDNREHDIFSIRNTSSLKITDKIHLEIGGESRISKSFYEFNEIRYNQYESDTDNIIIDTIDVNTRLYSNYTALYFQNTYQLNDVFSVMGSVRFSHYSFLKKKLLIAPRFALKYDLTRNLSCIVGYGIFNQADNIMRMKIYDGQEHPLENYSQSRHYLGSLAYNSKKTDILLNVYYKDNVKLPDDYNYDVYNRLGGAVSIIDRTFTSVSGYSKGLEATYRQTIGSSSISLSYIYAINKIKNMEGKETYRDNDRRHTVILNNLFILPKNWSIGTYFHFHTGEPYSPTSVSFIGESSNKEKWVLFYNVNDKNTKRLPNYSSFDLRVDKTFLFKNWNLSFYVNILNLFSHENIRNYYWYPYENSQGNIMTSLNAEKYISKIFISPGLKITF